MERTQGRRLAAILLAIALILGGVAALLTAVPVRAQTLNASGMSSISVTAVSITAGFSPNTIEDVATGANVTITFTNADSTAHTFTIWGVQGTVIPNPQTVTGAQLNKLVYGSGVPPLAGLNLSGSDQTTGIVNVATPGWYEFMCMEPGHFQAGMYGFIAFGESLPPNLSVSTPTTGPGAAVFIIVGTIVTLVVIAVALGFIVGRRRGSEFEMPPERLGYPEPAQPGAGAPAETPLPSQERKPPP